MEKIQNETRRLIHFKLFSNPFLRGLLLKMEINDGKDLLQIYGLEIPSLDLQNDRFGNILERKIISDHLDKQTDQLGTNEELIETSTNLRADAAFFAGKHKELANAIEAEIFKGYQFLIKTKCFDNELNIIYSNLPQQIKDQIWSNSSSSQSTESLAVLCREPNEYLRISDLIIDTFGEDQENLLSDMISQTSAEEPAMTSKVITNTNYLRKNHAVNNSIVTAQTPEKVPTTTDNVTNNIIITSKKHAVNNSMVTAAEDAYQQEFPSIGASTTMEENIQSPPRKQTSSASLLTNDNPTNTLQHNISSSATPFVNDAVNQPMRISNQQVNIRKQISPESFSNGGNSFPNNPQRNVFTSVMSSSNDAVNRQHYSQQQSNSPSGSLPLTRMESERITTQTYNGLKHGFNILQQNMLDLMIEKIWSTTGQCVLVPCSDSMHSQSWIKASQPITNIPPLYNAAYAATLTPDSIATKIVEINRWISEHPLDPRINQLIQLILDNIRHHRGSLLQRKTLLDASLPSTFNTTKIYEHLLITGIPSALVQANELGAFVQDISTKAQLSLDLVQLNNLNTMDMTFPTPDIVSSIHNAQNTSTRILHLPLPHPVYSSTPCRVITSAKSYTVAFGARNRRVKSPVIVGVSYWNSDREQTSTLKLIAYICGLDNNEAVVYEPIIRHIVEDTFQSNQVQMALLPLHNIYSYRSLNGLPGRLATTVMYYLILVLPTVPVEDADQIRTTLGIGVTNQTMHNTLKFQGRLVQVSRDSLATHTPPFPTGVTLGGSTFTQVYGLCEVSSDAICAAIPLEHRNKIAYISSRPCDNLNASLKTHGTQEVYIIWKQAAGPVPVLDAPNFLPFIATDGHISIHTHTFGRPHPTKDPPKFLQDIFSLSLELLHGHITLDRRDTLTSALSFSSDPTTAYPSPDGFVLPRSKKKTNKPPNK